MDAGPGVHLRRYEDGLAKKPLREHGDNLLDRTWRGPWFVGYGQVRMFAPGARLSAKAVQARRNDLILVR